MDDDIDIRRRRAAWRAGHRGTKELDLLIGGFATAKLPDMSADELTAFEQFLELDDGKLQTWLLSPVASSGDAVGGDAGALSGTDAGFISAVRQFHGLS